jgi:hypothetical protein
MNGLFDVGKEIIFITGAWDEIRAKGGRAVAVPLDGGVLLR